MNREHYNPKERPLKTAWGAKLYRHPNPRKADKGLMMVDYSCHAVWGQPFATRDAFVRIGVRLYQFVMFCLIMVIAFWCLVVIDNIWTKVKFLLWG